MKLYGSDLCPDCPPVIEYLNDRKIVFEYVNIMESIQNLKEFTVLRDRRNEFDLIKESGSIGIPCLLTSENEVLFEKEIRNTFY